MDPFQLKKDFGKDIVFWGGGADTQKILAHGTTSEVKDYVRRNIDALASGGGFIFAAVHNMHSEVPPENILAIVERIKR